MSDENDLHDPAPASAPNIPGSYSGVQSETAGTGTSGDSQADEGAGRAKLRKILVLGLAGAVLVLGGGGLYWAFRGHNPAHASIGGATHEPDRPVAGTIPVNTVRPRRKLLQRTLDQPGSIRPWAQAELYAKASGYLLSIQRIPTPRMVADLVLHGPALLGTPMSGAGRVGMGAILAYRQAPQIDIGATVTAGELLMEIAAPEKQQEIVEKETLVRQREAELEAAQTALATFEASILTAKAMKQQALADVRRFASEYTLRKKEWQRLKDLVVSRTVTAEVADEKENQANAALAAWESSQAKIQSAEAELTVISSKLTTARAEIKVKETLVQFAKDALRLAVVLSDYNRIHAPFDGIVTYRDVDEGDFIQNATSGQARRLMTVTALDKVKVVLQVPDRDAPWVQLGTDAVLAVDARSGKPVYGKVSRMANALDPQTRTMQVEIDLDNPGRNLLPGMYGKVILVLQKIPDAAAIPATAVYSRKGENFILQVQDGISRRQRVRIRYDDGKEMEVVKLIDNREVPLVGTEELIISNKGEIAEGQRVKTTLVNQGTANPPAGAKKDSSNGKKVQSMAPGRQMSGGNDADHAGLYRRLPSPFPGAAADRSADGSAAGV